MENISSITKECIKTDKPLITIVMAVYKPNIQWLEEQLDSLNSQTYPNLELLVRDDCPDHPVDEAIFKERITAFPYKLMRNEKNLGSNETFERLTLEAQGEYISYCDQDDVWLPEKLTVLADTLEASGALLVCSDMYIIDGKGDFTADSITKVRRNHRFRSGEGLAEKLIFQNWVTGCTMLVKRDYAKAAAPFCPHMVHDHYLALCCAAQGRVESVMQPLIRYRIHGGNQTGIMSGVNSRSEYLELRIMLVKRKLEWLMEHFPNKNKELDECLENGMTWIEARISNMTQRKGSGTVWKYRRFGPKVSLFEVFAPYMPDSLFLKVIKMVKHNKI